VYVDILMGTNFIFNFYLLWLTSLVSRSGKPPGRILLGAALGAIFSLTLLLPQSLPVMIVILFPVAMVFATFCPFTPLQGLKLLGTFYVITLLAGGALIALQLMRGREAFVLGSGSYILDSPSLMPLVLTLVLVTGMIRIIWLGISGLQHTASWRGQVTLRRGGKEKTMDALVDTGNSLREPVSGSPVIIVYYQELMTLLEGLNVLQEDFSGGKLMQLTECLSASVGAGICIIPFKSLGKGEGYLPGFRPEEVVVSVGDNCRTWSKGQVVVCLSPERVSTASQSLALVHPELI
jgi:stage II sporulation protein GA (sporulation sigma-E factor processing peptidase)